MGPGVEHLREVDVGWVEMVSDARFATCVPENAKMHGR